MFSSLAHSKRGNVSDVYSGLESPTIQSPRDSQRTRDEETSDYESSPEDPDATPPSYSLLSDDPFSNENSRILFDAIDKLRRCGAGQDLDLPQLVIVGKQSAGKSSLLQSLTDIPFPVGNRLCTQFAMRIVSRRTAPGTTDVVHASIEPGDVNPFSIREDDTRTKSFQRFMPSMTAEDFENLVNEAKEAMGIDSPHAIEDKNYSSMVLKIELSGPKRSHFGILDLPGVFSAQLRGVSKREMEGVQKMVTSYMKKPENIIICVADASGDISNEQILPLASEVDSSRLVGVLTKCDKSDSPADIVKHVNDQDGIPGKPLKWYVVQNRGPKATASFDREEEEEATFGKAPWTEIPSEQRGTAMLKKYLANLLCKRIRDAFPSMLATVTRLLENERAHRKTFGESRAEHSQKLSHLMEIVGRFQILAGQALRSPGDLEDDGLKLRGLCEREKDEFAREMMRDGCLHKFLDMSEDDSFQQQQEPGEDDADSDDESRISVPLTQATQSGFSFGVSSSTTEPLNPQLNPFSLPITPSSTPKRGSRTHHHTQPTAVGLQSQYSRYQYAPSTATAPITITTANIRDTPLYLTIRTQISTNRGEELPGLLNPSVLKPLFRIQTSKWHTLSSTHLSSLISLTSSVAERLFLKACDDVGTTQRTREGLLSKVREMSRNEGRSVLTKLGALCENTTTLTLQTNNPSFSLKIQQARMSRFRLAISRYNRKNPVEGFMAGLVQHQVQQQQGFGQPGSVLTRGPEGYKNWLAVVDEDRIASLFKEVHACGDDGRNVEDEIHDVLKAYYEVSLQNFIYDISHNISEPFLLSKKGPLLGINQEFVLGLSAEEVEELGGEDESLVIGRRECEGRIERLERAREEVGKVLLRVCG